MVSSSWAYLISSGDNCFGFGMISSLVIRLIVAIFVRVRGGVLGDLPLRSKDLFFKKKTDVMVFSFQKSGRGEAAIGGPKGKRETNEGGKGKHGDWE